MIAVSERIFLSMFKDEPEVLTVPEAARLLAQASELSHLSPNHILLRIKKKEIFASLIGTRYVISKKSIIEYISSEKVILSSVTLKIMIEEFSASLQLICNQNNQEQMSI